jgi:hypothetical protein
MSPTQKNGEIHQKKKKEKPAQIKTCTPQEYRKINEISKDPA